MSQLDHLIWDEGGIVFVKHVNTTKFAKNIDYVLIYISKVGVEVAHLSS